MMRCEGGGGEAGCWTVWIADLLAYDEAESIIVLSLYSIEVN